ncbi:MAG: hypothetical protein ABI895_20815 [Deltaproteobacteria bacterium]
MMRSFLTRSRPLRPLLPGLLLAIGAGCSDDPTADPNGPGSIVNVDGPDGNSGGSGGSTGGMGGSSASSNGGVPLLRDPVSLGDDALARQALGLLGAPAVNGTGNCKNCHSLGRPTLSRWSQLTQAFATACLKDPELSDQDAVDGMLDCFKSQAGSDGQFAPESFGIYAAAAHLPWFSYVFEHAAGIANPQREEDSFVTRVGMPRSGTPLTQPQFDIVAEWFARKVPKLLDLVPADSGEACEDGLDGALAAHVTEMATAGWRARNAQVPLLNFGCAPGQTGSACLSTFPLPSGTTADWKAIDGVQIRVLHDNSDALSTYWSRVSADGRYIASGLRDFEEGERAGQILDLAQDKIIPSNFHYDATFFPDNSGFVVQQGGGNDDGGSDTEPSDGSVSAGETALTCDQSVLASDPAELTGDEAQCRQITGRLGLYQQLAKSVDGSDYWVIHGSYTSDNGGFEPVLNNPSAAYTSTSSVTLTPLVNVGNGYQAAAAVRVTTPQQGDPMLSPSGRLLVTRIKGEELDLDEDVIAAEQAGYALYKVNKTQSGGNWSASLQDLGRICVQGGKATFSYDERWMVFHRYVVEGDAAELGFSSASASGFRDYLEQGSSNLYLVDLSSGALHRFTNMPPGKFALFPHFRSDGWIYFVVRTVNGEEYFAATDAAIVAEGQN